MVRRGDIFDDMDVFSDDDAIPTTNEPRSQPPIQTTVATSNRMGGHGGETPVSKIPVSLRTPWKKTEQVVMPYYIFLEENTITTDPVAHSYRLNSIYDCATTTTYVADPTPAADTADVSVQTPMWRTYWMQFYRYWHVVKCNYRFRIFPTTQNFAGEYVVYVYWHGLQRPPIKDGTDRIKHEFRIQHPNMRYFHMKTLNDYQAIEKGTPTTGYGVYKRDHWKTNPATISGTFVPGMIQHEVVEDELSQTWHKETEVPPTPECITIIVDKSNVNEASELKYRLEVSLEYHVQLKDLKAKYQYVTQKFGQAVLDNALQQQN